MVAMVSNNTLASSRQQRLQRALVAFAESRTTEGLDELRSELPDDPVELNDYLLPSGETVVVSSDDNRVSVVRWGIQYRAYRIGAGIRHVPDLDTYLAGAAGRRLHWFNLYEDMLRTPK